MTVLSFSSRLFKLLDGYQTTFNGYSSASITVKMPKYCRIHLGSIVMFKMT